MNWLLWLLLGVGLGFLIVAGVVAWLCYVLPIDGARQRR